MANELVHATADRAAAGKLTQSEFDSITAHRLNSQAIGDIIYASTTTQLRRLGIGSTGQPLTVVGGVPAWGGDVALGANKLKTTSLYIVEDDANTLGVRYTAGGLAYWQAAGITISDALFLNSGKSLNAADENGAAAIFQARDTGVGRIEIARLQGAADPYFEAYPLRLKPIATASLPGTPVEGMLVYDDTTNKLKVYNGTAWETVTSA